MSEWGWPTQVQRREGRRVMQRRCAAAALTGNRPATPNSRVGAVVPHARVMKVERWVTPLVRVGGLDIPRNTRERKVKRVVARHNREACRRLCAPA